MGIFTIHPEIKALKIVARSLYEDYGWTVNTDELAESILFISLGQDGRPVKIKISHLNFDKSGDGGCVMHLPSTGDQKRQGNFVGLHMRGWQADLGDLHQALSRFLGAEPDSFHCEFCKKRHHDKDEVKIITGEYGVWVECAAHSVWAHRHAVKRFIQNGPGLKN